MKESDKQPWHLHPCLLAGAAGILGLLLTLFPPYTYEDLLGEPDLMFGNWRTYLFIVLCVAGFCFGAIVTSVVLGKERRAVDPGPVRQVWLRKASVTAAWVGAAIGVYAAASFIGDLSEFVAALSGGAAEVLRSSVLDQLMESEFSATNLLPLAMPLLFWAVARSKRSATSDPGRWKRSEPLSLAVRIPLLLFGLCLVLTLSRSLLIPYMLALTVLLSGLRWHADGIKLSVLVKFLVTGVLAIGFLFVLMAYFRSGAKDSPYMMLVGYVPASYNRLSAALSGYMTPDVSGQPYYSLRFFWHPPMVRRFIPLDQLGRDLGFQIPDSAVEGWAAEFGSVSAAGLNPFFIWATAFGYAYFDFGWWSPIYFGVLGILARVLWGQFLLRTSFGVILYPYMAAAIILWSTDNFMALPQLWVLVWAAIAFWMVERAGGRQIHAK